jgi:hypothetical protein
MNCDEIRELLSSAIDLEASPEERELIAQHLGECSACVDEEAALSALDQSLRQVATVAGSAERIAEGVLKQWVAAPIASASMPMANSSTHLSRWGSVAAVALTLVCCIWVWSQARDPAGRNGPIAAENGFSPAQDSVASDAPILPQLADSTDISVARLVQTSGTVEVKYLDRDEWLPVSFTPFTCPSDASVRTGEDSLCEVETSTGGLVRLDELATVHVRSAEDIELETGRIWCKAPDDGTLQLTPALAELPEPETVDASTCLSAPILSCQANCSVQAQLTDATDLQVHALEGFVDVMSDPFGKQLNSGEAVQIVAGRVDREYEDDTLLAVRWMLPLFDNESGEVETFTQRVLATIGEAKTGFLYEGDLVALGEPGAIPLLAFLRSPDSLDRGEARRTAARVLSQTAGESMIDDLIDLLSDSDPDVRVSIANALLRITGEDQGRPPKDWRDSLSESQDALSAWRQWRERQ